MAMKLKFFALLLCFCFLANAGYLIQLKYENGVVTQQEVYEIESEPDASTGGYEVSVGGYSTNISFPIVTMNDPKGLFADNGTQVVRPPSESIITEEEAETFIVFPEVPDGSELVVRNATHTLLSEPLKQPKEIKDDLDSVPNPPPAPCCPMALAIPLTLLFFTLKTQSLKSTRP